MMWVADGRLYSARGGETLWRAIIVARASRDGGVFTRGFPSLVGSVNAVLTVMCCVDVGSHVSNQLALY